MGYSSDLTDKQWELIMHNFEDENRGQHFRRHSKRDLVNGVLYLVKTGCQWEYLPHEYPHYKTVSSFYHRAVKSGLWEKILVQIAAKVRTDTGRNAEPSYALIDSQSAKTTGASDERGIDGGKKRKGANDI